NVTVFQLGESQAPRIEAPVALLQDGQWVFPTATILAPDRAKRTVTDYAIATNSSPAELELKLLSTEDMTFFELAALLQAGVNDSAIRSAAAMRLVKLLALPLVLTGSLF